MRRAALSYSLPALRAFETVARAGSLTEAAKELGLSVSAVSFHLRELQLALDAELVRRSGRGVAVTEDGAMLARGLSRGFAALDEATEAFRKRRVGARVVDISVLPVFATRWLIPRISSFQGDNPGVEVRVTTTERRVDLDREGYDCAVRCGPGDWQGVHTARLFPQRLTPVCNRLYAEEAGLPKTPADLMRHRLINNELRADEWALWLEAAGAPQLRLPATQTYDSRDAVLQAVLSGLGIGLADRSLLEPELQRGELIAPFDIEIPTGWSSYLVWSKDREEPEAAALFRKWLLNAAVPS